MKPRLNIVALLPPACEKCQQGYPEKGAGEVNQGPSFAGSLKKFLPFTAILGEGTAKGRLCTPSSYADGVNIADFFFL